MRGLDNRLQALERPARGEHTQVSLRPGQVGVAILEDILNTQPTAETREAFLTLVIDVHRGDERAHAAQEAGLALPVLSPSEEEARQRLDALVAARRADMARDPRRFAAVVGCTVEDLRRAGVLDT